MLSKLLQTECVKTGSFQLKSGEISKYYFDMKQLVSHPELLKEIGDKMFDLIDKDCNLLCGVPIGGLPVCSYISIQYNIPMIMVRDEKKTYGTQKQIEGNYKKNDKCIIIEDVITTGGSVQKTIDILKDKVDILGVIVIMNRQQGFHCSVPVKNIFTKTDIVKHKLKELISIKNSRLCFSADLDDKDYLVKMLDNIGQYIVICKIHYDFYNDESGDLKKKLIELSIKHDFLLMEDRKFVDISHTVKRQYKKYSNWVDMITVMGNVNGEIVNNLAGVLLVANMSNNSFNCSENAEHLSSQYKNNVVGFITQHRMGGNDMFCMTPGINVNTQKTDDQNYRDANEVNTDIFIVGRGIYSQKNYIDSAKMYSEI